MDTKFIAIGNRMMGDDGIAIAAAESLLPKLNELGIEVIIGETDTDFCIANIVEGDELIILDAAISGRVFGSVWSIFLPDAIQAARSSSWQHDADLLNALKIRGTKVSGLLICIETWDICFRWGLSDELQQKLPQICSDIYHMIISYKGGMKNA